MLVSVLLLGSLVCVCSNYCVLCLGLCDWFCLFCVFSYVSSLFVGIGSGVMFGNVLMCVVRLVIRVVVLWFWCSCVRWVCVSFSWCSVIQCVLCCRVSFRFSVVILISRWCELICVKCLMMVLKCVFRFYVFCVGLCWYSVVVVFVYSCQQFGVSLFYGISCCSVFLLWFSWVSVQVLDK